MIYPSIDKLLNIVDSKYRLVHITARRSKEMKENNHYQMPLGKYKSKNFVGENALNWNGGKIKCICKRCGREFEVDPSVKKVVVENFVLGNVMVFIFLEKIIIIGKVE